MEKRGMKSLSSLIGQKVPLAELPDGATSKHYNVSKNQSYEVVGVDGSCLRIIDNDKQVATIGSCRFNLS